jgi:hypothetical protein
MSLYYFHLWTGDQYELDETGLELRDASAAYLEAFDSARAVWIERLHERRSAARYRYDVFDCHGRLVHEVPFSEAMCQPIAKKPATGFVASADRGYALAADLAREIATAQHNLRACRELLAYPFAEVRRTGC